MLWSEFDMPARFAAMAFMSAFTMLLFKKLVIMLFMPAPANTLSSIFAYTVSAPRALVWSPRLNEPDSRARTIHGAVSHAGP